MNGKAKFAMSWVALTVLALILLYFLSTEVCQSVGHVIAFSLGSMSTSIAIWLGAARGWV